MPHLAIGVTRSDLSKARQGDDIEIGDFAGSAKRENIMTTSMKTYEINTNKHAYRISYIGWSQALTSRTKQSKSELNRRRRKSWNHKSGLAA